MATHNGERGAVCSGRRDCMVPVHVHGCYADLGSCDAPQEHVVGESRTVAGTYSDDVLEATARALWDFAYEVDIGAPLWNEADPEERGEAMQSAQRLLDAVGLEQVGWRYHPTEHNVGGLVTCSKDDDLYAADGRYERVYLLTNTFGSGANEVSE